MVRLDKVHLHESFNLAMLGNYAVVFVVRTMAMPWEHIAKNFTFTKIWKLGLGYENALWTVDGMYPVTVAKELSKAIDRAGWRWSTFLK